MKQCPKCKIKKANAEFSRSRQKKDGLQSWCKCCGKVYRIKHKTRSRNSRIKDRRSSLRAYLRIRWECIKSRCTNPNANNYHRYGGKGVCCLFGSFNSFFQHVVSDLGYTTIAALKSKETHRINNGNYQPGNIEFLTPKQHRAKHREMREHNFV